MRYALCVMRCAKNPMLMFKFFNQKTLIKIWSKILNSKITYLILLLIMLIQFILIGIIFFQFKKSMYLVEQTNFKMGTVESQQKFLNEQINGLQSNIMRMSSQMYRMQQGAGE